MLKAHGTRQRVAAWVLLVASSGSCAAAAVLALAHLPADGQVGRGTAALLALVAGLTTLVADVIVLGSGQRWWRRLLAVPIGAVLLAFVVYPVAVATYAPRNLLQSSARFPQRIGVWSTTTSVCPPTTASSSRGGTCPRATARPWWCSTAPPPRALR
jgi:hypothetical protein